MPLREDNGKLELQRSAFSASAAQMPLAAYFFFIFFFYDLRSFFLPNEEECEEAFHSKTCPFQPLSPFPFLAGDTAQGVGHYEHEEAESDPELCGGSSRLGLNISLTKCAGVWQETG